jgi:hypothetical protein
MHRWGNPRKWDRESRVQVQRQERIEKEGKDLPWVFGVRCQRFFDYRYNSGWFEVDRGVELAEEEEGEDIKSRVYRITESWLEHVQKKSHETIKARDESKEPDLWLRRVR